MKLMNTAEGSISKTASPDLAQLQDQLKDMQMEIDILKETINVLNYQKAVITIRNSS